MDELSCPGCQALQRRVAELEAQLESLTRLLEQQQRAGKRQAAPFAKTPPKPHPKKPGRKPGPDYGTQAHRQPPAPEQIQEVYEAPLPDACPHCSGAIDETHMAPQYQVEIPRQPIHRQFNIHVGCCRQCRRRIQGRHALQTSDALGAAAAQLAPDAQAAVVELNKQAGLPHGKISRVFRQLFGIALTPGGSTHIVLRAARRCEAVYERICQTVAASPWTVLDETGWHVGGHHAWLHTLVSATATAYRIDPTRSGVVAEQILGRDYAGVMIHDGWSPYDQFVQARHQQCLAHVLRRCREMLTTATRGAVVFPRQVKELLQRALDLRDRHVRGEVSGHGLAVMRGRFRQEMARRARPTKTNAANERLAWHLWKHLDDLFTFLEAGGVDATNWRAELAMRFGVILRKVWGGNRSWVGARAQAVLMSVWRTCGQRGVSALDWLSARLRNQVQVLPLPP
jgi:transposase